MSGFGRFCSKLQSGDHQIARLFQAFCERFASVRKRSKLELILFRMSETRPIYKSLDFTELSHPEQFRRASDFYELLNRRRTVRDYSDRDVPIELIEKAIATAGTAPSGANMQPWRFVVVRDPETKSKIREAAEKEERESYQGRMSEKWLRRLAPLGTDEHKPFLEIAPYLIVVFRITSVEENGETEPTYYSQESVGIAVGMLLAVVLAQVADQPHRCGRTVRSEIADLEELRRNTFGGRTPVLLVADLGCARPADRAVVEGAERERFQPRDGVAVPHHPAGHPDLGLDLKVQRTVNLAGLSALSHLVRLSRPGMLSILTALTGQPPVMPA